MKPVRSPWSQPRGRRPYAAVARDATQLLAAAGALYLLPTWLALQEVGWRQRRRNTVGTIGASPAELCGGHDERGAAGVLGIHTTRSRATNYRHIRALEVLGLLSRERLRGAPRRGPGAEVLYALFAHLVTDHEAREREKWVRRSARGQGRTTEHASDPSRGPPDLEALERDLISGQSGRHRAAAHHRAARRPGLAQRPLTTHQAARPPRDPPSGRPTTPR